MDASIPPAERVLDYLRAARTLGAEGATAPLFGDPERLVQLAALRMAACPIDPEQLVMAAANLIRAAELALEPLRALAEAKRTGA